MYILQHTGLWSVKVSLLFFFKNLGRRSRTQRILWWCVAAFIAATLVVCFGIQGYECMTTPFPKSIGEGFHYQVKSFLSLLYLAVCRKPTVLKLGDVGTYLSTLLDILTDASSKQLPPLSYCTYKTLIHSYSISPLRQHPLESQTQPS
jgi:hypothetical protein